MTTHDAHDGQGIQPARAIDPVCGMQVNPAAAAATSEYQGTTYYFCALGCKRQFDRDPERYVSGTNAS